MQRRLLHRVLSIGLLVAIAGSSHIHARKSSREKARIQAEAQALAEQEEELLNLAAMMLKNGDAERAGRALGEISLSSTTLDRARYWLLAGLISMSDGDMPAAEDAFRKSIDKGIVDPMIWVFIAQAAYRNEKYADAAKYLESAGPTGDELAGTHLLRANAYWKSGDVEKAMNGFSSAAKRFPDNPELWHSHVVALIELGLFQEAVQYGRVYLERVGTGARDYTAFSESLIQASAFDEAILVLEQARLQFSDDRDLTVQLARAYMKAGYQLIAARLFHAASINDPAFVIDAAELYRRHGQLQTALRLNEKVDDQKAKMRQRLGILIEMERFEEAAALAPRLQRLGLLREDALRYAVAYAQFKVGLFAEAEKQLAAIHDPEIYSKAMELRLAMEKCRVGGWMCH